MTPSQKAKLIAIGVAIVTVLIGAYVPDTKEAMTLLFGIAIGKEFMGRTGDVSVTSHPDDLK